MEDSNEADFDLPTGIYVVILVAVMVITFGAISSNDAQQAAVFGAVSGVWMAATVRKFKRDAKEEGEK